MAFHVFMLTPNKFRFRFIFVVFMATRRKWFQVYALILLKVFYFIFYIYFLRGEPALSVPEVKYVHEQV